MLIKELIRKTLPMQGFHIEKVITSLNIIQIKVETYKRYKRKYSKCGRVGKYRYRWLIREFMYVQLWRLMFVYTINLYE
jgi:hypothetical protein